MALMNGDAVIVSDDFEVESTDEAGTQSTAPLNPIAEPQRAAQVAADDEQTPAVEVKDKPAPTHKRITEAAAKEAAAKRERDEAIARAARLESELATYRARTAAPPNGKSAAPDDPEPTLEDFREKADPYTEWIRAQAKWEARKEVRESQQKARAEAAQHAQHAALEARANTYRGRLSEALAKEELTLSIENLQAAGVSDAVLGLRTVADLEPHERPDGGTAVADYLAECENPLALMRYLSDNPQEFQAMLSLHPMKAFGQMGRLEERMTHANTQPARETTAPVISAAKAPIKPVGGSLGVSDDAPPGDDADLDRHIKWHNQRDPRFNPKAARH